MQKLEVRLKKAAKALEDAKKKEEEDAAAAAAAAAEREAK